MSFSPNVWFGIAALSLVVGGACQAVSLFAMWSAQQAQGQRWNAKMVLEFELDREKKFHVRNRGTVDAQDVAISITHYELVFESEKDGTRRLKGVGNYSVLGDVVAEDTVVPAGEEKHFELRGNPLVKFYRMDDGAVPEQTKDSQYALRVAFRNGVTREKKVYYYLASAREELASVMERVRSQGQSGPVDHPLFGAKIKIREHQQAMYDDAPEEFYRMR